MVEAELPTANAPHGAQRPVQRVLTPRGLRGGVLAPCSPVPQRRAGRRNGSAAPGGVPGCGDRRPRASRVPPSRRRVRRRAERSSSRDAPACAVRARRRAARRGMPATSRGGALGARRSRSSRGELARATLQRVDAALAPVLCAPALAATPRFASPHVQAASTDQSHLEGGGAVTKSRAARSRGGGRGGGRWPRETGGRGGGAKRGRRRSVDGRRTRREEERRVIWCITRKAREHSAVVQGPTIFSSRFAEHGCLAVAVRGRPFVLAARPAGRSRRPSTGAPPRGRPLVTSSPRSRDSGRRRLHSRVTGRQGWVRSSSTLRARLRTLWSSTPSASLAADAALSCGGSAGDAGLARRRLPRPGRDARPRAAVLARCVAQRRLALARDRARYTGAWLRMSLGDMAIRTHSSSWAYHARRSARSESFDSPAGDASGAPRAIPRFHERRAVVRDGGGTGARAGVRRDVHARHRALQRRAAPAPRRRRPNAETLAVRRWRGGTSAEVRGVGGDAPADAVCPDGSRRDGAWIPPPGGGESRRRSATCRRASAARTSREDWRGRSRGDADGAPSSSFDATRDANKARRASGKPRSMSASHTRRRRIDAVDDARCTRCPGWGYPRASQRERAAEMGRLPRRARGGAP